MTISNRTLLIITGGNRGLGYAIINEALKAGSKVVSLARKLHKDHESFTGNQLVFSYTDMAKPFDPAPLNSFLNRAAEIDRIFLVLNAAVITPLERVGNYGDAEIANSIAINVSYNTAIVNFILRRFLKKQLTLVNISSGASRKAIENWSLYCAGKAYMEMLFETVKLENQNNSSVSSISIDPGAMDTEMQENIRISSTPSRDYFENLLLNQKLKKPSAAAKEILGRINF